jgi:hypothetical protein
MSEHRTPKPGTDDLGKPVPPSASDTKTEPNPHATGNTMRPDQQEGAPPVELFKGAGNEVEAYADVDDPEALREAMNLGVEHEGIEAAQLLGLIAATLIAIAALVVTVFYFLIGPAVEGNLTRAESIEQYPELASTRAAGLAKINDYAVESAENGTYRIPIEDAQRLVMRGYGMRQDGLDLVQTPALYSLGSVATTPAPATTPAVRSATLDQPSQPSL